MAERSSRMRVDGGAYPARCARAPQEGTGHFHHEQMAPKRHRRSRGASPRSRRDRQAREESFETDRVSRRSLREFLRAPHRPVVVAFIDDELAGYALVSLRKTSRAVRIYSLAVDPQFARRGVGRALLQACEAYARRHRRAAHHARSALRQRLGDRALRELRLPSIRRARPLLRRRGDRLALREVAYPCSRSRNREQSAA